MIHHASKFAKGKSELIKQIICIKNDGIMDGTGIILAVRSIEGANCFRGCESCMDRGPRCLKPFPFSAFMGEIS
jgi:hypothetical protein